MVNTLPRTTPKEPLMRFSRIGRDYALIMPGFFISTLAFVLLVPLTVLSIATLIVWVGALLLPLTLQLATGFARLSRSRVQRWKPYAWSGSYPTAGPGIMGHLRHMSQPRRWLDLAFETIIAFPLHIFTFVMATIWTVVPIAGISYLFWGFLVPQDEIPLAGRILEAMTGGAAPDTLTHSYLLDAGFNFIVGALFLVTLPLVIRALAHLDAAVSAAALGGTFGPAHSADEQKPHLAHDPASVAGLPSAPRLNVWDESWTWIAAILVAVVSVAIGWPLLVVLYDTPVVISMLLALAHATALILVIRWLVAGIALQTLTMIASVIATAGTSEWPWPWPVMGLILQTVFVLLISLRKSWPWAVTAWLLPQLAVLLTAIPLGIAPAARSSLIVSSSLTLGILGIGIIIRQLVTSRGALQEERRTSADLSAQRQELSERNRIAHELHDVVAHSMSVITVQATTAKYRLAHLDPEAEREFASIAVSSRQALSEMRSLLTLLRAPDDLVEPPVTPQPTLADIPSLVEATRRSGEHIALRMNRMEHASESVHTEVSAAIGLTAYRIAQEALSNAMRHSPGAEIVVDVAESHQEVSVEVSNGPADGMSMQPAATGAGLGLMGVKERTDALGGSLEAGATDSGGFCVRAVLPLRRG